MDAIGIDLGGTNLRAGIVGIDGSVSEHRTVSSATDDSAELIRRILALVNDLQQYPRGQSGRPLAVGIGAAGMITRFGTVVHAPNLPVLRQVALGSVLTSELGYHVQVENDATAAAWGEFRFGALQGADNALMVTLGTGIGGGIIIGGNLVRGAHGFAAEIGHFQTHATASPEQVPPARCACGSLGHWEAYGSGTALGALVADRLGRQYSAAEITDGFHNDEPAIVGCVEDYSAMVAIGIAGLINILDPETVAISGGVIDLGPRFVDMLTQYVRDQVEAPESRSTLGLVAATLGSRAGLVGAAELARSGS